MITLKELHKIMPHCHKEKLEEYLPFLNAAMEEFGIMTPQRQAAFIAQLAHESGEFRYMEEIASGAAYEGRADLGNVYPGDGKKYKGRGPIQITGRNNYIKCGKALGLPLVDHPEILTQPESGFRAAGWFWETHNLNALADQGLMLQITKKINGGTNGLKERLAYYSIAQEALA